MVNPIISDTATCAAVEKGRKPASPEKGKIRESQNHPCWKTPTRSSNPASLLPTIFSR